MEKKPEKVKKSKFKVATINALGHSHTKPGGNKKGWLSSRLRTIKLVYVITRRRFSLVGLQEFQAEQRRVFKKRLNKVFGMHALGDNACTWLRVRWAKVDEGSISIPYFNGHEKKMPWVVLRLRGTNKKLAFMSTHNPANVRGEAGEWRKEGWRREADWAHNMLRTGDVVAVLVVGDKNAPPKIYRPFIEKLGGTPAGNPEIWGIDWIVGWGDVEFSHHKTTRNKVIASMTDHPVGQATCQI